MAIIVRELGPLFDGRAEAVIEEMVEGIKRTVADDAFVKFESNLEERIRHSGPVYQTYIQVKDDGPDRVVTDGWSETNELPYGPWLEGVGSRNAPVTRFEGYHSLRDAVEETTAQVDDLAQPVVDEAIGVINGE